MKVKFPSSFTFIELLIALCIGAILGIAGIEYMQAHAHTTKLTKEQVQRTNSVPTFRSMQQRWSSERFFVFGRETWMLFDSETQTQYVADAPLDISNPQPVCWASTKL